MGDEMKSKRFQDTGLLRTQQQTTLDHLQQHTFIFVRFQTSATRSHSKLAKLCAAPGGATEALYTF